MELVTTKVISPTEPVRAGVTTCVVVEGSGFEPGLVSPEEERRDSSEGRTRTYSSAVNSGELYQLSYIGERVTEIESVNFCLEGRALTLRENPHDCCTSSSTECEPLTEVCLPKAYPA